MVSFLWLQKEHRDFPCGALAVGEVGEEEAGPTSKEPLLSSLPCSVLPALQKAGTVCYAGRNVLCVSCGLCPVRHWPLYIYTSSSSRGILLSVTLLSSHLSRALAPTPTVGPEVNLLPSQSLGSTPLQGLGGYDADRTLEGTPRPFFSPITQP